MSRYWSRGSKLPQKLLIPVAEGTCCSRYDAQSSGCVGEHVRYEGVERARTR